MLAPLCYETNFFLAAQFAPQGNQAERSESEQGKSRATVRDADSGWLNADVVEEKKPGYAKEFKLQRSGGGQCSDVKHELRVTESRCIGQASKVRAAIPRDSKEIRRWLVPVTMANQKSRT